jgi:monoamine oxidase
LVNILLLTALLDELGIPYFKQHTKGISLFETMSFVPPQKFEIPEEPVPHSRWNGYFNQKNFVEIGLENIKNKRKNY